MTITYIHKEFLKNINHLQIHDSLLVAISGGQDSACLIKLIQDYIYLINNRIEYIYIDHQCKKDSQKQAEHLINYIKQQQCCLSIYQIKSTPTSEIEARYMRYQLLLEHAIKNNFSTIITGHTQTDKIETFLQKLIRGTTLNGAVSLKNIRYINVNLQIIRPMIQIKRLDIHWFCRKFFLPIWSDSTNYLLSINRNRLRYELIPYLQQFHKINIEKQINKFIENCHIDNEYIKQNTTKLYLLIKHKTSIAMHTKLLNQQHISIQTRVIQFFFS